jgi:uncharacterized caspase-like protein
VVLFILSLSVALAQGDPPRKALLIGNSAYQPLPLLATPSNDVRALAARLREIQFQTTVAENRTLDGLAQDIDSFLKDLRASDVALVYFAGYGVQSSGENYLLPVEFKPGDDPDYNAYSVKRILRGLESRQLALTLVVLDAARRPPALSARFPEKGLAILEPRSRGTIIAFSALPGQVITDLPGRSMSLYADTLTKLLERPGITLLDLFAELKRGVSQATSGEQTPTEVSTTSRDFVVRPQPPQVTEWQALRESNDVAALETFRRRYPNDPLAAQASSRIERLEWDRASVSRKPEDLRAFLARFPSSEFAAAARAALSQMDTPATTAPVDPQQGIQETLKKYAEAYGRKDLEEIKTLRPALSRSEVKALEQVFGFARSLSMQLEPLGPAKVDGDSATLRARITTQIRDQSGQLPPAKADISIRLKRAGANWVIESMQ